jgi:nucleoside-diphosphate-sugar epimerase
MDKPVVLILGITGSFGGAVAKVLAASGWTVTALARDPAAAQATFARDVPVTWLRGDALDARSVAEAARGAAFIVHAVNPPGYRHWREIAIPMLANTIAAAQASGAHIMFPGNIYNFGPDAWPLVSETAPQNPKTEKGKVRVEMELMLQRAAEQGQAKCLIVRAGDFYGPGVTSSWLMQGIAKGGADCAVLREPGHKGAGHAWAYMPDLAETVVRLMERAGELAPFDVFHFGGHWSQPGSRFLEAARDALGRPALRIKPFNWTALAFASPFVPIVRELRAMRYLWDESIRLDNGKLVARLGSEPATPLIESLRATFAFAREPAKPRERV